MTALPTLGLDQSAILHDLQRIIQSQDHPYGKLNQLLQKGAIGSLQLRKKGSNTTSTVTVVATDLYGVRVFSSTQIEVGIQKAKYLASEAVLQQVAQTLEEDVPSSLERPIRIRALTAAESKIRAADQIHADEVKNIIDVFFDGILSNYKNLDTVGILSIDLEMWEKDHGINLEVGLSSVPACHILDPSRFHTEHIVNRSYMHYQNSQKDLNQRENFTFGQSVFVDNLDMCAHLNARVEELTSRYQKVYIVGHSIQFDIEWLRRMGLTFMDEMIPVDIGRIYRWIINPAPYNLFNMGKMLRGLSIPHEYLHNAGNDARYGLDVLSVLAAGSVFNWREELINLRAH